MKQTTELVGSGDLGIDGKLAQSLIPQYSINGDNEKGKLEFEKEFLSTKHKWKVIQEMIILKLK